MGRKRADWAGRATIGAAALVLLLWPDSAARAAPTILLRFEHSGYEAGITRKDTARLRVAGYTWSDGTIDLLRDFAWHTPPPHRYATGGCGGAAAFDVSAAQYAFRLPGSVDTVVMDRVGTSEMAIPQTAERWLRTTSDSAPALIVHLVEATFEPAAWNPEVRH